MEKSKYKEIDAYELEKAIQKASYPIGFDFDSAFDHNTAPKSSGGAIIVNDRYYMQFGLRTKDIYALIDAMPAIEDPGGPLEEMTKQYNDLERNYKILDANCASKSVTLGDIECALDKFTEAGITLTNQQFLDLLKKEFDHPSYAYMEVEDGDGY